jgi:hypothetical protein
MVQLADWVRDDLPDLIWPALVLALRGENAAAAFARWQSLVQTDLRRDVEAKELAECLDGRLTGLERLATRHSGAGAIVRRRAIELQLLPDPVQSALLAYPERPASWLVPGELTPPGQAEIDLLVKAVLEAVTDHHREALLKCLSIWSAVQAGAFSTSAEMIELLNPYPNDAATRNQADTVICASWGAMKGVLLTEEEEARFDNSIRWAKVFWGINSMTTRCLRRRDLTAEVDSDRDDEEPAAGADQADDGEHLQQLAMDLVASYMEALDKAPSRLYDPEPQEVHAGLVLRAGREVITALGHPDLWSAEHGSHVTRVLVEARVLLQWMATQPADIYQRFQDYGAGKAKLYTRILDELPADARIDGYSAALEELTNLSHNHDVLDLRIVDTNDSFSGKSLRAMAEECGLLDFYRQAYYLASGVAHSEWWSIETHAMERCLNVLHRGHRIPHMALNAGGNTPMASAWVDQLYALIRVSLSVLGTDESHVAAAFSWIEGRPSDDSEQATATNDPAAC